MGNRTILQDAWQESVEVWPCQNVLRGPHQVYYVGLALGLRLRKRLLHFDTIWLHGLHWGHAGRRGTKQRCARWMQRAPPQR